jgi:hypothetical protein
MAIGVERESNGAVAEKILDELRMGARLKQYGRRRVTEVWDSETTSRSKRHSAVIAQ